MREKKAIYTLMTVNQGRFWLPGDTCQCLETLLFATAECVGRLLASSWWRPGMMPNMTIHKTVAYNKGLWAPMLTVPRPESPIIDKLVDENWG